MVATECFLPRCDRGFVQPHPLRQPAGAEIQAAGGSDSGRRGGGHADGGPAGHRRSRAPVGGVLKSVTHMFVSFQDETENSAERKSEQKSPPLENGLSPASGPVGHTPVATTPKAAAASQQTASTGSIQRGSNPPAGVKDCLYILLCVFFSDSNKPAAKSEDLVLSVLIGLFMASLTVCQVCCCFFFFSNTVDAKCNDTGSRWQHRRAGVRPGESAAVQGLPEGAAAAVQGAEGAGEEAPEENC